MLLTEKMLLDLVLMYQADKSNGKKLATHFKTMAREIIKFANFNTSLGVRETDLENWDYSWPNFNFDFCSECAKDKKACNEFYRKLAKPYIERHREYWSKQENIDKWNAEIAEWRKKHDYYRRYWKV